MKFPESPIKMRYEENTDKPCAKCRWHVAADMDPRQGKCTVSRTKKGAIWQRLISDLQNMTCPKYDQGLLSFRDHV